LECKERNTYRQYNLLQGKVTAEDGIDIPKQKIRIFVINQYQQVHRNDKRQKDFPLGLVVGFVHEAGKEIVYCAREDKQDKKHPTGLVIKK
jgi:hypothetical protein